MSTAVSTARAHDDSHDVGPMTITDDTGGIRCQSIETTRQQMDGKAADWRRAHASEPKLTFEAACVRRLTRQWRGRALSDKRHIPWFLSLIHI